MKNTPDAHRMEHYRQQMLDLYQQATPSTTTTTEEDNWLDRYFPEPNIMLDKAVMASVEQSENHPPAFVGYLRVFTFSGGGAEPIAGARVIVTNSQADTSTIYANLTTDRDGFTPVISLPSVDPALSLQPGLEQPYTTYSIRISADGFQTVEHNNVPIYGNNYVTQPVAMIPLLPQEDSTVMQEFFSGGPTNL